MIEKNLALKFRTELDKHIFNKSVCFYVYNDQIKELLDCDYKTLQKECNNLGFYIYKVKDSPIFREYDKNIPNKSKAYIIYSDYSLTLTTKF